MLLSNKHIHTHTHTPIQKCVVARQAPQFTSRANAETNSKRMDATKRVREAAIITYKTVP